MNLTQRTNELSNIIRLITDQIHLAPVVSMKRKHVHDAHLLNLVISKCSTAKKSFLSDCALHVGSALLHDAGRLQCNCLSAGRCATQQQGCQMLVTKKCQTLF